MTSQQPAPGGIGLPAITVHAFGIALGKRDEHTAELILHNPVVHAAAPLTREALAQLGQQMLALADELTDAPRSLELPQAAGRLIVPGADL